MGDAGELHQGRGHHAAVPGKGDRPDGGGDGHLHGADPALAVPADVAGHQALAAGHLQHHVGCHGLPRQQRAQGHGGVAAELAAHHLQPGRGTVVPGRLHIAHLLAAQALKQRRGHRSVVLPGHGARDQQRDVAGGAVLHIVDRHGRPRQE